MKKFISYILAGLIFIGPLLPEVAFAANYKDTMIHQQSTESQLAGGIRYENRQIFRENGWLNLNIAYIDLTNKNVKINNLFNKAGLSNKQSIDNLVKDQNPSVAINGDFFERNNGYYPLGLMVNDKKVISTPILNKSLPALYLDTENRPDIGFFDWSLNATVNQGVPFKIYYINKGSKNYGGIVMYDYNWNHATVGNGIVSELTEVIVKNGVVTQILTNSPSIPMEADEFELVLKGTSNFLTQNIKVGDNINLNLNSNPSTSVLETAIGGGQILLKNKQKVHQGISIRGNQPRTAVGYTEDRKEMIFLTVDGRHKSFKGVSEDTLCDIMLDLGAVDALNLDGGGSTSMVINTYRNNSPNLVNFPSDGNPRRVINGFAASNTAPSGKIDSMKFADQNRTIFQNIPYNFEMTGFDYNGNLTNIDSTNINITSDDLKYTSQSNNFTALEPGKATLFAKYKKNDDIRTKIKVDILKPVKYISSEHKNYQVPRASSTPISEIIGKVEGINEDGFVANIDLASLDIKLLGDMGQLKEGNFISASQNGAAALVYQIGDAINYVNISVGYDNQVINEFENLNGLTASSYPKNVNANLNQSAEMVNGFTSLALRYDFTQPGETKAAYINFDSKPVVVMEQIDFLGLWVFGNESGHWLRAEVKDIDGKTYKLDFANNIDWKGWKRVTAELPADIKYPITLNKIYLVETNPALKDKGEILIDNFETLSYHPYTGADTPDVKNLELTADFIDINSNTTKYVFSPGIKTNNIVFKDTFVPTYANHLSKFDIAFYNGDLLETFTNNVSLNLTLGNRKEIFPKQNTLFFLIDNSKSGIRATDSSQWKWLLNNIDFLMDKNIIIVTSKPVLSKNSFDDPLEKELFLNTLESKFHDNNKIFVVSESNRNYGTIKNGVVYLEFDARTIDENRNTQGIKPLILEETPEGLKFNFEPIYKDISFVYSVDNSSNTVSDKADNTNTDDSKKDTLNSDATNLGQYSVSIDVGSKLNVRDSAGGSIIDKLENNTIVSLTGKSFDSESYHWVEIKYDNKTGWVAMKFLKLIP